MSNLFESESDACLAADLLRLVRHPRFAFIRFTPVEREVRIKPTGDFEMHEFVIKPTLSAAVSAALEQLNPKGDQL